MLLHEERRLYLLYIHWWRLVHEYCASFSFRKQSGGPAAETVSTKERGDEIVLREKDGTMVRAFDLLASLPDDLVVVAREKDQPQKRKRL
jgi:hypothetical protein